MAIKTVLTTWQADAATVRAALKRPQLDELNSKPLAAVEAIITAVRKQGDRALLAYTQEFDGVELTPGQLEVPKAAFEAASKAVSEEFKQALAQAKANIASYYARQLPQQWLETCPDGSLRGVQYQALARVGIYVPGGTAPLASSVLMTAVPAQVAGVEEIIMVTPPGRQGQVDPHILVAAQIAGVTRVFQVGGAQAIAALAYGTETIPAVDKIVGPGNLYVTLAKKLVFGRVGIDMLAGPSEILVIADSSANPRWVAADLLSQAEHGVDAGAILITTHEPLVAAVQAELAEQLEALPRAALARQSLAEFGRIIVARDLAEAASLANLCAPEHLELAVVDPWQLLPQIKHAGAIFLGHMTPESVGDYLAGPSHVLPTNGTARFSSPLGVEDFLKRSSLIAYSPAALAQNGTAIMTQAEVEALGAHAQAVRVRLEALAREGKQ